MIAAICDDQSVFRKEIREFLKEYKKSRRLHIDIMEFADGKTLLESSETFDIVFLDYEMPGLNGIETARALRAKKSLCCIIYLTSYPEHVFEAFEVGTYRYIVKPIDHEKLTAALDDFIKEKKMMAPIMVNTGGELLTISSEDIIYLEADGKYCYIRTADIFVRSSKTIAGVLELLPKHCFFRTHKSFAVNFYCIDSIKGYTVSLNNGEKVRVSRSYIAEFKNAYRDFLKHFVARM